MITIVQQTPQLAPVYNDLVMTAVSDKVISKFKFKYVFDIFAYKPLDGYYTYVGRVKVTPNPSGYGMLDISRYLQNQVDTRVSPDGTDLTINTYELYTDTIIQYYVNVGEEYADTLNGQVILYNGNDTIASGTTLTSINGNTCYGFDGVKQFDEGYTWTPTSYVTPTNRKLLTNSPRTLYKEEDEFVTISALWGTYSGTPFNMGINRADVYDVNNNLIKTYPSTPSTGYTYTSGVIDITNYGENLSTIISGYTNTWNKVVVRFGFTTGYTESITIYKKVCPWDKYDPVDILWVNRLGGWDNFRFFGSKQKSIKIDRTTYKRAYGSWSDTSYTYKTYERGTKNIKTDVTQEGEVMSDFLDRDTVNWLEELLTSPQVFIIESSTKVRPINITDANFTNQLRGNTKLRQVSFKYQYSELIRTQQK